MVVNWIEIQELEVFTELSGAGSASPFAHNQAMLISFALARLSEDCLSRRRVPQRWLKQKIYGRAQVD